MPRSHRDEASQHERITDDILSRLPKSLNEIKVYLRKLSWYSSRTIPEDVKKQLGICSNLIPAKHCFLGSPPSVSEILQFCSDLDAGIVEKNSRHMATKTVNDVLQQLEMSQTTEPMAVHNISVQDMISLSLDAIPIELHPMNMNFERFCKDSEQPQMNIAPTGKIVDIHIDQGTCGLSIGVGKKGDDARYLVRKIWFFWPPTKKNFQVYTWLRQTRAKLGLSLARCHELEHGIIEAVDHDMGVLLPPGWLHATITTNGGFLVGATWNVPDHIKTVSNTLAVDIRCSPIDAAQNLFVYLDALIEGIQHYQGDSEWLMKAIDGWFSIEEAITTMSKLGKSSRVLKTIFIDLLNVWRTLLTSWNLELNYLVSCRGCSWTCRHIATLRESQHDMPRYDSYGEHLWNSHFRVAQSKEKCRTTSKGPKRGRKRARIQSHYNKPGIVIMGHQS